MRKATKYRQRLGTGRRRISGIGSFRLRGKESNDEDHGMMRSCLKTRASASYISSFAEVVGRGVSWGRDVV